MKHFIRLTSLLVAMVMLLAMPALAAEEATPRASNYILSTCVFLSKKTSTQFEVWYEVIALDVMDELGAYSISIQESTNGTNWTTVRTYTPEDEPSMAKENAIGYTNCVTYTGVAGRYYKAHIILFAANSSGEGHVSRTTETLYLPYPGNGGRQG